MLAIVLEQAKAAEASKVTKINLTIGQLSGIVPECVQLQFEMLSLRTMAAGASLAFNQPPASVHCRNCDETYSPEGFQLTCPKCRKKEFEVISGRECRVESIEVE